MSDCQNQHSIKSLSITDIVETFHTDKATVITTEGMVNW